MTDTFTASFQASLALHELAPAAFGGQPEWNGQMGIAMDFAAGVGAQQCDLGYFAERTLTSGSTDSIDLVGSLLSPLGQAMVGAKIALLAIINKQKDGTANTTALTVGAGSNKIVGLMDSHVIQPGGFLFLGSPGLTGIAALTAATADLLQIVNAAGATNKYQIAVLGRSA
jgi:hypothetical protein